MNATDVRIGNLIDTHWGVVKVTSIQGENNMDIFTTPNKIGATNTHGASGIPLTEEWLLRFGFKKIKVGGNLIEDYRSHNSYIYRLNNFYYKNGVFSHEEYDVPKEIKYVHELQNLYFALTGKELEYAVN